MKKKQKPYIHAPAYTRAELKRLKGLADVAKINHWDKVQSVSHITPRAFCVAKTAPLCAVFAIPTCDREPQVLNSRFTTVQNKTCAAVQTGDWCAIAYVMTQSCGEPVVLEILKPFAP